MALPSSLSGFYLILFNALIQGAQVDPASEPDGQDGDHEDTDRQQRYPRPKQKHSKQYTFVFLNKSL